MMNKSLIYYYYKRYENQINTGIYVVTGANGNIGQWIVRILVSNPKNKIIAMCHSKKKAEITFKDILYKKNLIIREADIKDKIILDDEKIDYIIHAAGICNNKICKDVPNEVIQTNIIGTYNILEYAKNNKIKKLCFLSSASVYGMLNYEILKENCRGDIDFLDKLNAYAYSKRIGEMLCNMYSSYFQTLVVRPFHIIEPNILNDETSMLGEFFNKAKKHEIITIRSDVKRNLSFILDIVIAILVLLSKCENSFDCYNIGNPNGTKNIETIANDINQICRNQKGIVKQFEMSHKASNNLDLVPDLDKLKKDLDIECFLDLEQSIKASLRLMEELKNE